MNKYIAGIIIFVLILVGLFALQFFGLVNYKFFAPKYENVRREVWENTQSFTEGKRQEATKLFYEYKNGGDKDLICQVARMSFANIDLSKLHYEQRSFIESCF